MKRKSDRELAHEIHTLANLTIENAGSHLIELDETIKDILTSLISGTHILLVGLPGVGKTLIVKTLSSLWGFDFKRIQFTPDLLPNDITGSEIPAEIASVTGKSKKKLIFEPGPLFANLILGDEINRAPPKTQSALLEAMEERQVSYGSETYMLPKPFLVMATQNPLEMEGTYPLPEAQLDRFAISVELQYPAREAEKRIATLSEQPVLRPIKFAGLKTNLGLYSELIDRVPIPESLLDAIVDSVRATRPSESTPASDSYVVYGAGPRATRHLVKLCRARALIEGDTVVNEDHVRQMFYKVLSHRIQLNYAAVSEGIDVPDYLNKCLTI